MGLVGPNGAGKSTLFRLLMSMLQPDSGEVFIDGQRMPDGQRAAKAELGYYANDVRLYPGATLGWHMGFVASIYPRFDPLLADRLLQMFALSASRKIRELSTGDKVKAALLLLLARRPRLLLLDEPTAALDPVVRQEILQALMEAVEDEQRAVLFASHHTADVERISDVITFLDRGQIVASSDKESYLDRWRRLRLEWDPDVALPQVAGVCSVEQSGRLAVVTMNQYDAEGKAAFERSGAKIHAVERLSLEEIFVATVQASRKAVQ